MGAYAHYKLNENAESTTVTDYGSGGNNGTASGDADTLAGAGKVPVNGYFSGGGKFNGEETHLTVPDSADWDIFGSDTGEWTVDFWIRIDSFPSHISPFTHYEDVNNRYYVVIGGTGNANISIAIKSGGSSITTPDSDNDVLLADGIWRHVAMVFIDNEIGFYVDGNQVTYQTMLANDSFTGNFLIGATTIGTTYPHNGAMDEFRVYNGNPFNASPNSGKTDTITVPTSAHTSDANTKLLLHMDGDETDSGNTGHTVTNNGVSFGGFEFNGADEYINVDALQTDIASDTIGSIVFWFNKDDITDEDTHIFALGDTNAGTDNFIVSTDYTDSNSEIKIFYRISSTNTWVWILTSVIESTTWYHFAIVQDGIRPKFYLNGVDVTSSGEWNKEINTTLWFAGLSGIDNGRIGCSNYNNGGNQFFFPGKIDDFRYYKTALSPTEVANIYYEGTGTETDAYAHFKCNDDAGNTTVTDDGYGANNGTASTNTSNLSVAGKINSAFEFNGMNEYVSLANLFTDVSSDTSGSVSFWFYAEDVSSDNTFLWSFADTNADSWFGIRYNNDNEQISISHTSAGATKWSITNISASVANWHHLVLVQNGTSPVLYIDNTAYSTLKNDTDPTLWIAGVSGVDNMEIGDLYFNNSTRYYYFQGKIDDFRYYKTALTEQQILDIYNGGDGTEYNPAGYYELITGFPHSQCYIIS